MTRVVLVALLALVLAGCVETPSVRTVATSPLSRALRVHVTDEPRGPPLAGALVSVRGAGENATTDDAGNAVVSVGWRGVDEIIISAPARTEEHVRVDADAGNLTVALYRSHMRIVIPGSLGPAAVGTYPVDQRIDWHALDLKWASSPEAARGYANRVVRVNATLRWNNTPTSAGDLALVLSSHTDRADVVADHDRQIAPGPQEEAMRLQLSDLARWNGATQLYAGAGTSTASVGPTGLPYTITVEADFDPNVPRPAPAHGAVAAIAALSVAALMFARRAR